MPYNWGPHITVPTAPVRKYCGIVQLREELDENLLAKELEGFGIYRWSKPGYIVKITNTWYYRKKNTNTWIEIGESEKQSEDFTVTWDTTGLKNARYEVLGLMRVFFRKDSVDHNIARHRTVVVTVENDNGSRGKWPPTTPLYTGTWPGGLPS